MKGTRISLYVLSRERIPEEKIIKLMPMNSRKQIDIIMIYDLINSKTLNFAQNSYICLLLLLLFVKYDEMLFLSTLSSVYLSKDTHINKKWIFVGIKFIHVYDFFGLSKSSISKNDFWAILIDFSCFQNVLSRNKAEIPITFLNGIYFY
jgi:hypothetical protein